MTHRTACIAFVAVLLLGFLACLQAEGAPLVVSIAKVADTTTPFPTYAPNASPTFTQFGIPVVENGTIAFVGHGQDTYDGLGRAGGVYAVSGGVLSTIVDTNTIIPGETTTFFSMEGNASLHDGGVAFRARAPGFTAGGSLIQGIYTSVGGSLTKVADNQTNLSGVGVLDAFATTPSFDGQLVAFIGYKGSPTHSNAGVYTCSLSTGDVAVVADQDTIVPGSSLTFSQIWPDVSLDEGAVAFRGIGFISGGPSYGGFYTTLGGSLSVIADLATPIPDRAVNFTGFGVWPDIDGDAFSFSGAYSADDGVYLKTSHGMEVVADETSSFPGFAGSFSSFGNTSLDNGNVAFIGFSNSKKGLYVSYEGQLARVVVQGDVLDGKTVTWLDIGAEALSGDLLAWHVGFSDGTWGIYSATMTVPEPSFGILAVTAILAAGVPLVFRRRGRPCPRQA